MLWIPNVNWPYINTHSIYKTNHTNRAYFLPIKKTCMIIFIGMIHLAKRGINLVKNTIATDDIY